jgi:hypothetical protein
LDDDKGGCGTSAVVKERDVYSCDVTGFGFESVVGEDETFFEKKLFCGPSLENGALFWGEHDDFELVVRVGEKDEA